MDELRSDLARRMGSALDAAGFRLADDGESPGLRVAPVAAGVRIRWNGHAELIRQIGAAAVPGRDVDAELRATVHLAVARLLTQLGYAVAPGAAEGDVVVLLRAPAPIWAD